MPIEAQEAGFIINTCKFFGCLPSQLMEEDASLLRMLKLYHMAGYNDQNQEPEGEEF